MRADVTSRDWVGSWCFHIWYYVCGLSFLIDWLFPHTLVSEDNSTALCGRKMSVRFVFKAGGVTAVDRVSVWMW